jgi:hypothetical protein
VLVIGGGEIAERKIKFLLRAGAGAGGRSWRIWRGEVAGTNLRRVDVW